MRMTVEDLNRSLDDIDFNQNHFHTLCVPVLDNNRFDYSNYSYTIENIGQIDIDISNGRPTNEYLQDLLDEYYKENKINWRKRITDD